MRFTYVMAAWMCAVALGQAGEPASLKGTWVREMVVAHQAANQVVATFTDSRLTVIVRSGAVTPKGEIGFISVTMSGEYAVTKSGIVCCVVSGFDIDVSHLPVGDDYVDPIGPAFFEINGQPICFRATVDDGTLHVSEIKVPTLAMLPSRERESSAKTVLAMAGGSYKSSKTDTVPFPKLKPTTTATSSGVIEILNQFIPKSFDVPVNPPAATHYLATPPTQYAATPTGTPTTPFPLAREPVGPVAMTPPPGPVCPSPVTLNSSTPIPPMPPDWKPSVVSTIPTIELVSSTAAMTPPITHLQGVWYREMIMPGIGGGQVILTIKGDRLKMKFVEFGYGEANEIKSGSFEYYCTYHRGEDGYAVGRCLGVDIDVKNVPEVEMVNEKQTGLFSGVSKAEGEPYSFRCELRDGALYLSDVRMKLPGEGSDSKMAKDIMTAMTSGKYKLSTTEQIPLPKVGQRKEQPSSRPTPTVAPTGFQSVPQRTYRDSDLAPPLRPTNEMIPPQRPVAPPTSLLPAGSFSNEPIPDELRRKWAQSEQLAPLPPPRPAPKQ